MNCSFHFPSGPIRLAIVIIAGLSLLISACSAAPETTVISPTGPATATATATEIPAMATSIAMPAPTATPDPLVNAAESISLFKIYDDFSGPFDGSKWIIHQPDENNPFSFEAKDGIFTIHMNGEQFGYATASLDVLPEALSADMNGVSVVLPAGETLDRSSPYGLHVTLSDQNTHWQYRCYNLYQASRVYCELEDVVSGATLYSMDPIPVSPSREHKIQVEWIPQSGLLLTFLDGQLVDYQTLSAGNPLLVENAGLFAIRGEGYADGDLLFSEFRLGTYRESGLALPDDLLPHWEKQYQYSVYGIDYYTYDDFNYVMYDGSIDLNRWIVAYEDEQRGDNPSYYFGQEEGQFVVRGRMVNETLIMPQDEAVRGFQVDVLPQKAEEQKGQLTFSLSVRDGVRSDSIGSHPFEFACMLEFDPDGYEDMWCGYFREESDQVINTSTLTPILEGVVNTVRMEYDDALGSFLAYVNGNLVIRMPVEEAHQQIIRNSNLSTGISYIQTGNGQMAIDNVLLGLKGEPAADSRFETPQNVTGVLPHSDLYLYDDFDDSKFNGSWNTNRWSEDRFTPPAGLYQQDGSLRLGFVPDSVRGAYKLTSNYFYTDVEKQRNAVQVIFSPKPQTENRDFGLIVMMDRMDADASDALQYQGGVSCDVNYRGDVAYVVCGLCLPSEGCNTNGDGWADIIEKIAIDPYIRHVLALEYDDSTTTYSFYLDGERLVEHQTVSAPFYTHLFSLRVSGLDQAGPELMIDNVMLGTPAEHPEALKVPQGPLPLYDPNSPSPFTAPEGSVSDLLRGTSQIVETSDYASFYAPADLNSGIAYPDSAWNIEDGYEQRADNLIVIPQVLKGEYRLDLRKYNNMRLSDINAVSYTLAPEGAPPYGWDSGVVFRRNGATFHFNCFIHYEQENTYFGCQSYDEERPQEGYDSDRIVVDPLAPHRVSVEVEAGTHIFHVSLDRKAVFDINMDEHANFDTQTPYDIYLLNSTFNDNPQQYKMRLEEFLLGTPPG